MYTSYCSMVCALRSLETYECDSPLIADARKHLASAVSHAENYHTTWNSIYWNTAKASTKRRVREELNHLAYDAFTEFLDATEYLNQYVETVQGKIPPPPWWSRMFVSLILAYDGMLREHDDEIASKQLKLFDDNDMSVLQM